MTDRYPPDPRDEVRLCENIGEAHDPVSGIPPCCNGRGYVVGRWMKTGRHPAGETGIFILAADQRVVEVRWDRAGWYTKLPDGHWMPREPTKDEALLAARCSYWGVEVHKLYDFYYTSPTGAELAIDAEGLPTPEAALCAAIDAAMKEKP